MPEVETDSQYRGAFGTERLLVVSNQLDSVSTGVVAVHAGSPVASAEATERPGGNFDTAREEVCKVLLCCSGRSEGQVTPTDLIERGRSRASPCLATGHER
jgi:hypothetical protein